VATASVNHMVLWTDLEGTELNGRWTLVRQVRSQGRTGWFEAREADGRPVMLIITETLNDEDELMERLRAAATVRHPNVVQIEDSLLVHLEDTPMVIAVTEVTEENLGDVLRERTLGAEETRQVLDALLAGLAAIHGRGLVHGRMEPGSVLATGDTIKLRSDCVHAAGDGFATAAGEDVRGLGRIVVQAMTRRIPAGDNDPVMQLIPEPMARAVRRALSGRATVDEIATLAGIRLVAPPPTPAPPKQQPKLVQTQAAPPSASPLPQPAAPPPAATASVAPAPVPAPARDAGAAQATAVPAAVPPQVVPVAAPAPEPQAAAERPRPVSAEPGPIVSESRLLVEDEDLETDRHRAAPWIVIAAIALIVITIFVLYGMLHHRPAKQSAAPAPAPAATAPIHRAPAVSRPSAAVSPRASSTTAAVAGPGWRVVTYTYGRQNEAEQKARDLQQRFPRLQFSVFTAPEHRLYLVTVGGVMSKADALALRQQAVRMGLPRDTYVQNFR
jgi:hypothetical protein